MKTIIHNPSPKRIKALTEAGSTFTLKNNILYMDTFPYPINSIIKLYPIPEELKVRNLKTHP